jgi:hypothetical protein
LKPEEANDWLRVPRPTYLIIPLRDWPAVEKLIREKYREVGRRYDFLSRDEIIVISNTDEKGDFLMNVARR